MSNTTTTNTFEAAASSFLATLNSTERSALSDPSKALAALIQIRLNIMLDGQGPIEISPNGSGAKRTHAASAEAAEEEEEDKKAKAKRGGRPSPTAEQLLEDMDGVKETKELWYNQRYANNEQKAAFAAVYAAEEHADLFDTEGNKDDKYLAELIGRGDSLVNSKLLMWAVECIWARLPAAEKNRIQKEETEKIEERVNARAQERHEHEVEYHAETFELMTMADPSATFTMWITPPSEEDGEKRKRGSDAAKFMIRCRVVKACGAPFTLEPDADMDIKKLGKFLKDDGKTATIRTIAIKNEGEWMEVEEDPSKDLTAKFVASRNRWIIEETNDTLRFEDVGGIVEEKEKVPAPAPAAESKTAKAKAEPKEEAVPKAKKRRLAVTTSHEVTEDGMPIQKMSIGI